MSSTRDLELLSDDEALFEELEREEDNDVAAMREKRIKEIQNEWDINRIPQLLLFLLNFFFQFRLNRRHARAENQHGLYTDIAKEKEFMDITTSEKYVVGHFYHKDFRRCKIMDTHLEVTLAKNTEQYR